MSLGLILPEAIEPVGARAAADDAGSWFPPQRVARTVREGPCCLSSGPQGAIDALHREALHRLVRLFKERVLEQVATDPAIRTLLEMYDLLPVHTHPAGKCGTS